jgi:hypothetical protein
MEIIVNGTRHDVANKEYHIPGWSQPIPEWVVLFHGFPLVGETEAEFWKRVNQ